jgi:hypothetical protein
MKSSCCHSEFTALDESVKVSKCDCGNCLMMTTGNSYVIFHFYRTEHFPRKRAAEK